MQPEQLIAQLAAEVLGIRALALVVLWQPKHSCRWQHCPHHGKTVAQELRLAQERRDREARKNADHADRS